MAVQQAGAQLLPPLPFIVLVIADQRLLYTEVIEQFQRHPRILSGDEIAPLQRLNGAGRKIRQVADGGAHQRQSSAIIHYIHLLSA